MSSWLLGWWKNEALRLGHLKRQYSSQFNMTLNLWMDQLQPAAPKSNTMNDSSTTVHQVNCDTSWLYYSQQQLSSTFLHLKFNIRGNSQNNIVILGQSCTVLLYQLVKTGWSAKRLNTWISCWDYPGIGFLGRSRHTAYFRSAVLIKGFSTLPHTFWYMEMTKTLLMSQGRLTVNVSTQLQNNKEFTHDYRN